MKHQVKILVVDPQSELNDAQDYIAALMDEGFEIQSVSLTGAPTSSFKDRSYAPDKGPGLYMAFVMVKKEEGMP